MSNCPICGKPRGKFTKTEFAHGKCYEQEAKGEATDPLKKTCSSWDTKRKKKAAKNARRAEKHFDLFLKFVVRE
jgi:hypothetical protein